MATSRRHFDPDSTRIILRLTAMLAATEVPMSIRTLAEELACPVAVVLEGLAALRESGLPVALEGEEADGDRRRAILAHPGFDNIGCSRAAVARLGVVQGILDTLLPARLSDLRCPAQPARPLGRPSPLPSAPGWPVETDGERARRLGHIPAAPAEDEGAKDIYVSREEGWDPAGEAPASTRRTTWHPLASASSGDFATLLEAVRQRRTCFVSWVGPGNESRSACVAPMRLFTVHDAVWFTCWAVTEQGPVERLGDRPLFLAAHRLIAADLETRDTSGLPVPAPRKPDLFGGEYNRPFQMQVIVAPPAADYVEERIWDEDQSTSRLASGEVLLEVGSASPEAALGFVLSLGEYARVLTPSWLRKRVAATCRAIADRDARGRDEGEREGPAHMDDLD